MDNKLGAFLKEWRKERNLGLRDLSKLTGISHAYLHVLEAGVDPRTKRPVSPTLHSLQKLSAGLNVSLEVIISLGLNQDISLQQPGRVDRPGEQGLEVREDSGNAYTYAQEQDNFLLAPVVGQISAGNPAFSEDDIEEWWPVDISIIKNHGRDFNSYFYLRVQGPSMEPVINDGDMVLIKKGPVKDGQIALMAGSAIEPIISRIHHLPDEGRLMLVFRHPDFQPRLVSTSEYTLVGRVIYRLGEPKW